MSKKPSAQPAQPGAPQQSPDDRKQAYYAQYGKPQGFNDLMHMFAYSRGLGQQEGAPAVGASTPPPMPQMAPPAMPQAAIPQAAMGGQMRPQMGDPRPVTMHPLQPPPVMQPPMPMAGPTPPREPHINDYAPRAPRDRMDPAERAAMKLNGRPEEVRVRQGGLRIREPRPEMFGRMGRTA